MLAPAKINLTLDITGRREDGYHLIHTIMQAVDYTDEVRVRDVYKRQEYNNIHKA